MLEVVSTCDGGFRGLVGGFSVLPPHFVWGISGGFNLTGDCGSGRFMLDCELVLIGF